MCYVDDFLVCAVFGVSADSAGSETTTTLAVGADLDVEAATLATSAAGNSRVEINWRLDGFDRDMILHRDSGNQLLGRDCVRVLAQHILTNGDTIISWRAI